MKAIQVTSEEWIDHVVSFDNVLHVGRGDNTMAQYRNDVLIAYITYEPKKKYFIVK